MAQAPSLEIAGKATVSTIIANREMVLRASRIITPALPTDGRRRLFNTVPRAGSAPAGSRRGRPPKMGVREERAVLGGRCLGPRGVQRRLSTWLARKLHAAGSSAPLTCGICNAATGRSRAPQRVLVVPSQRPHTPPPQGVSRFWYVPCPVDPQSAPRDCHLSGPHEQMGKFLERI